jgi:hypothetical protein
MMLTTPAQIAAYQMAQLRQMVKLEAIGMKRRGRSATMEAKLVLGLNKSTKREEVLARLEAEFARRMALITA